MTRVVVEMILLALVAGSTIPGIKPAQRARSKRNRPPTIESFTSSVSAVYPCPFADNGSCSSSRPIVELEVKASDLDNDSLTYAYSVTQGALTGIGAFVNWDLSKASFGMQTIGVEVTDQRGGKASSIARVNVVLCGSCDPPCPFLSVTCPSEVTEGDVAVFAATISGVGPDEKLIYLWSHSNGKRIAGEAAPELRIVAIGSAGDVIKGTVEVLGIDPTCSRQASCESRIVTRARSRPER
jgi:hypothetical protein